MSNVTLDLQPIVVAFVGVIVAITPLLVAWLGTKLSGIAAKVDGQNAALVTELAALHAKLDLQASGRLADAKGAPPVGVAPPGQVSP